ncbi:unnamed protein product [Agarophyton chilense]|eukprot:gb/GEZJ01003809.1/.p2 GENE.gb/GEZJ01003809.1/~~gb/GEZJ01003809.1/.p2  ORF type:complete len:349 (-),score=47.98 gb/GEZJ01003809.1/:3236-4282(-)
MSCFDLRVYLPSRLIPSHSTPSAPKRSRRARSHNAALPNEDLSASKRRLVCIRRQEASIRLEVGFRSRTGWQLLASSPLNQDSLAVILPLPDPHQSVSLFAVFDAHGKNGHRMSAFVAQHFTRQFQAALSHKSTSISKALQYSCRQTAASVKASALESFMTGTTLAAAIVHKGSITCANLGDSRVVVATVRNGIIVPISLTEDHIPEVPRERKRIESAGGRVERWTPANLDTGPARIWLKDKRLPGLSVSRVIGDTILSGIVSSEPEITSYKLTEQDQFIIVATDGIWNVMSNQDVVQFIAAHGEKSAQRISEALVRRAAAQWFANGGETIDDISAIVVRLRWPRQSW